MQLIIKIQVRFCLNFLQPLNFCEFKACFFAWK
uniref:Uncharacterized protein n=1 Tax=Rhizophora mucronata TaxID=61149 RepID=A0A2P2QNF0_RHIMU